ncbi:hypothetical protein D5R81_10865 [Parashewanella spongiae]|uniref:Uncharacterized protein n=1 Tax=Parashewanella spongiae TaxID=342950 RepID=A0A3A6TTR4_9GAMM|nr:tetratricopeptide repeat protein [Parashewanella spongiae]MCL1078506.1 tetratricopeptide repeat protein [Parashewanella spongiae]RJY14701.1 hypothetical protein D5R81_10865 [Parashewanella spongiae]
MKSLIKTVFFLICSLQLQACSHNARPLKDQQAPPPSVNINYELFPSYGNKDFSHQPIFQLSEKQQQIFLTDHKQRLKNGVRPDQAVADFLQSKLSNFTYYGETYDAQTTMYLNKGNCMSLAMLTAAFAKIAGLEFDFVEVNTIPIFDKQGSLIMSSNHVQTRLYDPNYTPKPNRITLVRPHTVIDYFPDSNDHRGKNIDHSEFIAKYYNNIAAEALIDDRIELAFQYAMAGYKADEHNPETLNLLAVLHKRSGDFATAEQLYLAGMHYESNNIRLLSNYIILLERQQRMVKANALRTQLAKLDDPNPYNWLEQAYIAQSNQQDAEAIKYYRKVLKLAPYVQPAYLGLYQVYLSNQRPKAAQKVLTNALEWSYDPEQRQGYKYKLYQLSKPHSP